MTYREPYGIVDQEHRNAIIDKDWYDNDLYQDIEDLIGVFDMNRDSVAEYVAWKKSKYRKPIHDWASSRHVWRSESKNPLILLGFWALMRVMRFCSPEKHFTEFSTAEKLAAGLALRPKCVRRIHLGYGHWTDIFDHG